MANSNKALDDKLRETYLKELMILMEKRGEDILRTGTNEFCFPCKDEEDNEKFIQIIVKVPIGSRDGELFDGYSLAESYKIKQKNKAIKRKESEERKKKKIERDKRLREEKKNKEKGE